MPPEPEVVRTPRTGIPIQHRVAVVIGDPPPPPIAGWNTATPRAMAEPRLGTMGATDAWRPGHHCD